MEALQGSTSPSSPLLANTASAGASSPPQLAQASERTASPTNASNGWRRTFETRHPILSEEPQDDGQRQRFTDDLKTRGNGAFKAKSMPGLGVLCQICGVLWKNSVKFMASVLAVGTYIANQPRTTCCINFFSGAYSLYNLAVVT